MTDLPAPDVVAALVHRTGAPPDVWLRQDQSGPGADKWSDGDGVVTTADLMLVDPDWLTWLVERHRDEPTARTIDAAGRGRYVLALHWRNPADHRLERPEVVDIEGQPASDGRFLRYVDISEPGHRVTTAVALDDLWSFSWEPAD